MATHRVLFDGGCGLCRRSRRMLERLDSGKRLDFVDIHDSAEAARALPDLRREDLLDEMHVIDPTGRVTRGFDAFRTIAGVLPALWPIKPLLHVPGIPPFGRRLYGIIARNRRNAWFDGACAVHAGSLPRRGKHVRPG